MILKANYMYSLCIFSNILILHLKNCAGDDILFIVKIFLVLVQLFTYIPSIYQYCKNEKKNLSVVKKKLWLSSLTCFMQHAIIMKQSLTKTALNKGR